MVTYLRAETWALLGILRSVEW